ncbi:hypothetical protein [Brevundimonas subvibrioides]|uniref:hypothetical protein n=1 Tax=Brevundimonas subvibrioides TaxID=74313 RepID=UPI0022B3116A|nr:hypothetical protein [Brevundimonas subvibrioides]
MDQNGDFVTAVRMIVTAVVSAVVTASLVIAVGQSVLDHAPVASGASQPALIRASG